MLFRSTGITRADCSATSRMFITNAGALMQVRPYAGADSSFPVMASIQGSRTTKNWRTPPATGGLAGGVKYTRPRRVDSRHVPVNRMTAVTNSQKV